MRASRPQDETSERLCVPFCRRDRLQTTTHSDPHGAAGHPSVTAAPPRSSEEKHRLLDRIKLATRRRPVPQRKWSLRFCTFCPDSVTRDPHVLPEAFPRDTFPRANPCLLRGSGCRLAGKTRRLLDVLGWTLGRWVELMDGKLYPAGFQVALVFRQGLETQKHRGPALGWGLRDMLGLHLRVGCLYSISRGKQAHGPFSSRPRSLFNLGVVTKPFLSFLKWFPQVRLNYSKALP